MRAMVMAAALGLAGVAIPTAGQELLPFEPPDTAKHAAEAVEWAFGMPARGPGAYDDSRQAVASDQPEGALADWPGFIGPKGATDNAVLAVAADAARMFERAGCEPKPTIEAARIRLTEIKDANGNVCEWAKDISITIDQLKGLEGWAKVSVARKDEVGTIILPGTIAGPTEWKEWTLRTHYDLSWPKWNDMKARLLTDVGQSLQSDDGEAKGMPALLCDLYIGAALDGDERKASIYSSLSSIVYDAYPSLTK